MIHMENVSIFIKNRGYFLNQKVSVFPINRGGLEHFRKGVLFLTGER